jgi:signal transduction histidine kinase
MQNTNPTTSSGKKDWEAIKMPILVPLFVAITLLLIIFMLAIYNIQQKRISDDVRTRLDATDRCFNQFLLADARLIGETTHFVKDDPNIQRAWLTRDREKLLSLTAPLYEKLNQDYRITHLYFIDADGTCFLRVHNPSRFGDVINRYTLKTATKTKKSSWGIELGPYGSFTLRIVQPWIVNNSIAGYIEFGEEIDHIAPEIRESIDVDIAFLIDKSLLQRETWEEGLKIMGRTGNWDLMPDCVIADSTMADIPPEFMKPACLPHEQHQDRIFLGKADGSSYRAGFVRLSDAAGREVGDIIVIKNTTKELASVQMLIAVLTTVSFLIASALVSFFYIHIAGIEKRIIETHASLATEIEKRKDAESELLTHRDNLEELVYKRTYQLQETNIHLQREIAQRTDAEKSLAKVNDDLESTIAQLSRTNKQLGEFAHLAAHDLKTPLRGIGTLAQWLYTDYYNKLDDNAHHHIDLLIKRVTQMDNIVNSILQYSTTNRNKSKERKTDLNKLLKDVIDTVRPPQNIKIIINKTLPVVICEDNLLWQVFLNLISNAVKFSDKPQSNIIIDIEDEKYFWKFSVADNGPGIEPQHFERIFQLFQMLSTRDDVESEGVGLTLTKKIVELYEGKIWLTSKLGVGSTFFFTLPKKMAGVSKAAVTQS